MEPLPLQMIAPGGPEEPKQTPPDPVKDPGPGPGREPEPELPPKRPPEQPLEIPPMQDPPPHEPARRDPPTEPPDVHDPMPHEINDPPAPGAPPEIIAYVPIVPQPTRLPGRRRVDAPHGCVRRRYRLTTTMRSQRGHISIYCCGRHRASRCPVASVLRFFVESECQRFGRAR